MRCRLAKFSRKFRSFENSNSIKFGYIWSFIYFLAILHSSFLFFFCLLVSCDLPDSGMKYFRHFAAFCRCVVHLWKRTHAHHHQHISSIRIALRCCLACYGIGFWCHLCTFLFLVTRIHVHVHNHQIHSKSYRFGWFVCSRTQETALRSFVSQRCRCV